MRRSMIVTVEAAGDGPDARLAVALLESRLMRSIILIDEKGGIDGTISATFCAAPLADTLIEDLARIVPEDLPPSKRMIRRVASDAEQRQRVTEYYSRNNKE